MTDRVDYPYGFCGMPCALCSRYRTQGKSRCMGCSAGGYYTDNCKVYTCCQAQQLTHCANCAQYRCARLGKMNDFSDQHTNHAKERCGEHIHSNGFASWYTDYCKRADLLTIALARYNNGRMKRFLCELFLQQDLPLLQSIMQQAENLTEEQIQKGQPFQQLVRDLIQEKVGG